MEPCELRAAISVHSCLLGGCHGLEEPCWEVTKLSLSIWRVLCDSSARLTVVLASA